MEKKKKSYVWIVLVLFVAGYFPTQFLKSMPDLTIVWGLLIINMYLVAILILGNLKRYKDGKTGPLGEHPIAMCVTISAVFLVSQVTKLLNLGQPVQIGATVVVAALAIVYMLQLYKKK